MASSSPTVLEIWLPLHTQQEFNMATTRAILLTLAALASVNQVSAYDGTDRQVSETRGFPNIDVQNQDPGEVNHLRRCVRALAGDLQTIRRSLQDLRTTEIQQGMGQMQEGTMQILISDSDEECLPYAGYNSYQPQVPNSQPVPAPVYNQHAPAPVYNQPAPYPYPAPQQQYSDQAGQGGIYDQQNQGQYGYLPSQGSVPNLRGMQAAFGQSDSSNMALQLESIRKVLNANAEASRSERLRPQLPPPLPPPRSGKLPPLLPPPLPPPYARSTQGHSHMPL